MSVSKRLFSRKELLKLIFPLIVELGLTLLVGMIDSVMVSSVGEAAVSEVSLIDTVFQHPVAKRKMESILGSLM